MNHPATGGCRRQSRQGLACSSRRCCSGGTARCFPKLFRRGMRRSLGRLREIFYLQRCQQCLLRRERPAPNRKSDFGAASEKERDWPATKYYRELTIETLWKFQAGVLHIRRIFEKLAIARMVLFFCYLLIILNVYSKIKERDQ